MAESSPQPRRGGPDVRRVLTHLDVIYDAPPVRCRCRCVSGLLLGLCQRCDGLAECIAKHGPIEFATHLVDETWWCDEWARQHGGRHGEA